MAKLNDIRALAESHAAEISQSVQAWTGYLDTAATLYRYDFPETLLIHAQRPEATACAELDTWNRRMGRWVNRGSRSIALIDDSGPRKSLRYVFDISDTHMVRGGKTPYIWQIEPEIRQEIADYLIDTYRIENDLDGPLASVLMAMARKKVEENLQDSMDGFAYEIKGTWLEDLGEDAVREGFRRLLENSTYYMLASRCGLNPWEELMPDDFTGITNFNRLSVLSFLGKAANEIAEPILRDIGREVIFRYRIRAAERTLDEMIKNAMESVEKKEEQTNGEFSASIRENKDDYQITSNKAIENEGRTQNGSDLHEKGRLSVPEPDGERGAHSVREVRNAAEVISEGKQEELVPEHDADRETGETPAGDRRDSERADGEDFIADGAEGRRGRETENSRPDGLGRADEQYPQPSGRDRFKGMGVQLIPEDRTDETENIECIPSDVVSETRNIDKSPEAEDTVSSAFSIPAIQFFPDLPTVAQQRRQIEQRTDAVYATEYNALKQQFPDALIGFEHDGSFEFYGKDALAVAEILELDLLKKEIPGGAVDVTGFEADHWQSELQILWSNGKSIYLAGENKDGSHYEVKYLRGEDFLPHNAVIRIDDRNYRIDTVDFVNGTVSMQDMTMAREVRYPIFRNESIYYVRSYYEEQYPNLLVTQVQEQASKKEPEANIPLYGSIQSDDKQAGSVEVLEKFKIEIPQRYAETNASLNQGSFVNERREEEIEQTVFDALQKSGTDYGEYSPEQMEVIYDAAEKGYDVVPLCSPDYPPQQMQLNMHMQPINGGKTERIAVRSANSFPAGMTVAEHADDLNKQGTQEQEAKPGQANLTGKGSVIARLKDKKSEIAATAGSISVRLRPEPTL